MFIDFVLIYDSIVGILFLIVLAKSDQLRFSRRAVVWVLCIGVFGQPIYTVIKSAYPGGDYLPIPFWFIKDIGLGFFAVDLLRNIGWKGLISRKKRMRRKEDIQ